MGYDINMKTIRIVLLVLIIIGLGLIFTQKFWVDKVVDYMMSNTSDKNTEVPYVAPEPVPEPGPELQQEKENPPPVGIKSGISGTVTTSPTCPVETIPREPGCEPRPYAVAINILKSGSTEILKTIQSGSDGKFSVELNPGSYILRAGNTGIFPRCEELAVEVKSGKYTMAEMSCDTGIR